MNIDTRINKNAGIRPARGELAAHNLQVILQSSCRRGSHALRLRLASLAHDPGTIINPARRAAFARRWLRRILKTAD